MNALHRLASLLCLFGVGLISNGCSKTPTPPVDAGNDAGSDAGVICVQDSDCPDPHLFYCNSSTGVCEPSCRQASDCLIATRGTAYALPYCDSNPLKCVCDNGACVAALCSADADCGSGTVCRNGACVPAPLTSTVASCIITPDVAVAAKGATELFSVFLYDAQSNPVVLPPGQAGITWSGLDSSVSVNGSANGASAVFNAVSASTTTGAKVQVGSATCQAKLTVLDPSLVPTGKVEVVMTDEMTGRPVAGATVVANDATTGAQLDSQTTAADGTATLTAAVTVHITGYHTDFSYLTVAGYNPAAPGATRLLSMIVRRNPLDLIGGYAGTFGDLPASSNVLAGLASNSIGGSIADLDFDQVLGASVKTHVTLGTAINQDVDLPVGTFLEFNQSAIKGTDAAAALAGVCTDAFAGGAGMAEPLITSGQCGTRTAWAFGGNLLISDLPISALTGGGGLSNIDFGAVLTQLVPAFKKFNSSVGRDVQFKLNPPGDAGFDSSQFTHFDHDFQGVPFGFGYVVKVPTLPQYGGHYVDGVVVVPGTTVPGRGVVPLGIGAGVNSNPLVGTTDIQVNLPATSLVLVRQAPLHAGLEGYNYGLGMVAVNLSTIQTNLVGSALLLRLPGNKLTFDQSGNNPVQMGASFVAIPENAKFNWGATALPYTPPLAPRAFGFATAPNTTGLNILRVQFSNSAGHRWTVLGDVGSPSFTLPSPPATFEDRVFSQGPGSGRSTMLVQMYALNTNPAGAGTPIPFKQLVELGSTNADHLTDFTTAFSVDSYGRPSVKWTTPSGSSQTVPHGSNVTVTVTNFSVGTTANSDGIVRLSFTGGTGCTGTVDGTSDTSGGLGQISIQLPQGCTGTVGITATLYDNEPTPQPISPPVSAGLTAITLN